MPLVFILVRAIDRDQIGRQMQDLSDRRRPVHFRLIPLEDAKRTRGMAIIREMSLLPRAIKEATRKPLTVT